MVKRKKRRHVKTVGLERNNLCPYCGRPVQNTNFIPKGLGHAVTHWFGPGVCAFIPNAQMMAAMGQGVRDVIGEVDVKEWHENGEMLGYISSGKINKDIFVAALFRLTNQEISQDDVGWLHLDDSEEWIPPFHPSTYYLIEKEAVIE